MMLRLYHCLFFLFFVGEAYGGCPITHPYSYFKGVYCCRHSACQLSDELDLSCSKGATVLCPLPDSLPCDNHSDAIVETVSELPRKRTVCYHDGQLKDLYDMNSCLYSSEATSETLIYLEEQVWDNDQQEWLLEGSCIKEGEFGEPECAAGDVTFSGVSANGFSQPGTSQSGGQALNRASAVSGFGRNSLSREPPFRHCSGPRLKWVRIRGKVKCAIKKVY